MKTLGDAMGDWRELENGALVHAQALVAPWVLLGPGCIVHPFAVVGRMPDHSRALARQPGELVRSTEIGARVVIGCHAVVYGDVRIGVDSLLGDYASVREGSRVGARCVIGRQVTLHYNVKIADDCRFMDGTHLTGDCEVGAGSFFGVGVVTSNDRRVDLVDYAFRGTQPCRFGERVMVGSGANVLAGVTVGSGAVIGAGAVVVKDVPAGATWLGPAAAARPERSADELRHVQV